MRRSFSPHVSQPSCSRQREACCRSRLEPDSDEHFANRGCDQIFTQQVIRSKQVAARRRGLGFAQTCTSRKKKKKAPTSRCQVNGQQHFKPTSFFMMDELFFIIASPVQSPCKPELSAGFRDARLEVFFFFPPIGSGPITRRPIRSCALKKLHTHTSGSAAVASAHSSTPERLCAEGECVERLWSGSAESEFQ